MKKLLLTILLIFISPNALAEWSLVTWTEDDDAVSFSVNMKTIKRNGNKVTVWELMEFLKPQKIDSKEYLSRKTKSLYDCENETRKDLANVLYEKHLLEGGGKVIKTFNRTEQEAEEKAIVPGSIGYLLMEKVCSK